MLTPKLINENMIKNQVLITLDKNTLFWFYKIEKNRGRRQIGLSVFLYFDDWIGIWVNGCDC